jgi:outer membrane protein assembly factor BamB
LLLLLAAATTGCRLLLRLPEEITDPRVREVHRLGEIPEEETWWQTRDRRKEEQQKLLFRFPLNQIWERLFDADRALSGAPVIDGRRLYCSEAAEGLVMLNEEDGIPIWTFAPHPGENCGPLVSVAGLLVFGTSSGRVMAVDPSGPRLTWEITLEESPPGIPAASADSVFFPTANGTVVALQAADGSLRWRRPTGEPLAAAPLVDPDSGRVYCGSLGGNVFCLEGSSGEVLWTYEAGAAVYGAPKLDQGLLYFGGDDGRFHCLRAEDGEPRWVKPTGAAIRGSPAVSDKMVLFGSWDGILYAVDRRSGRTRWKSELPNRIVLPPVCVDDMVIVGCQRSPELTALNLKDGRAAGSFKLQHLDTWFTTAPVLSADQILFAGISRGKLVALGEILEEEMSEEEASRARFEELLGGRREEETPQGSPPNPEKGAAAGGL